MSHQTCLYGEKSFVKLSYELFTGLLGNLWVMFYSFVSCLYKKDEFVKLLHKKIKIIQKKGVIWLKGKVNEQTKFGPIFIRFY